MKKATNKIGERFINKPTLGSCEFVIVKYNNSKDLWVQFQDEYRAIVHTGYSNCQKGSVKNPYHPSVFGVGMIGLMPDGSKLYCLENCKFISNADNVAERNKRCSSKKVYAINIKTGERTRDFNSITEACNELGIKSSGNITQCIKGVYKQCNGYKWYEVED